jgi:DNA polymerase-3 subunit delta
VQAILEKIGTEPLPRAILVHGTEHVLKEKVLAALKERVDSGPMPEWNWSVIEGDSEIDPEPLLVELGTIPWGGATKVIALKHADGIPAAAMERIATWLSEHVEANCLAVFVDSLDKRLKYVRILQEFAWEIECSPLVGDRLIRYVKDYCTVHGKKMSQLAVDVFLERVGTEISFIQNELDKLIAFSEDRREIGEKDVQAITSFGPGQLSDRAVFQLTDFIAERKRDEALNVLGLLLRSGQAPLRILPLIERQLRLLLAAKTSKVRPEETARRMGENSAYPLKKQLRNAENYTVEELFAGFKAVIRADQELKLGMPGEQVLTDLIVKLT